MSSQHFSLNIIKDDLIGYLFVPYLLNSVDETSYVRYKNITEVFLENSNKVFSDWQLSLIKLSNLLHHRSLNTEFNKKNKNSSFSDFFEKSEKNVQKFIKETIDNRKYKILELIKENEPIVFFAKDRNSKIYFNDIIKPESEKAQVAFLFSKEESHIFYELKVFFQGKQLNLQDENFHILTNKNPIIISENRLIWFKNKDFNGNKLLPFKTKKQLSYQEKHKSFLFEKFIKPAVDKFNCDINGFEYAVQKVVPKAYLYLDQTIFKEFIITPFFTYNEYKVSFYSIKKGFVKVVKTNNEYGLERIERNVAFENQCIQFLKKQNVVPKEKFFTLKTKSVDKYEFLNQISSILSVAKKEGFIVVNKLFNQEVITKSPIIQYTNTNNNDWFDLLITVQFGDYIIEFKELKKHILNNIREYELPDQTIAIIPKEWFAALNAFAKRTNKQNHTILQKSEFNLLNESKVIPPNLSVRKQITTFKIKEALALPKNTHATLRDYQKEGYKWLYSLTQNNFGVCLADDMGLGKTLQVITLLQKYFEEHNLKNATSKTKEIHSSQLSLFDEPLTIEKEKSNDVSSIKSTLIIVPKSLIYNWVLELQKFASELSFSIYHDAKRITEFNASIHKKHIIITTYGIVRQDIEFLENIEFSYLILDESHSIKNPLSKTYKAVLKLNSQFKVSITGTPFENKLSDLWSQMNFLNDGILGDFSYFEKTFIKTISNNANAFELDELKSIINPFILRRLKKEVAKDLPEKIEQMVYCKMLPKQAKWYEEEKSKVRNELLQKENKNKNAIDILASINKLRQIAIHPKLQHKESDFESGKFQTIIQYIQSILEQGDKFLIFSSYVKHLELFEAFFIEHNIDYKMLTGKTNNRQQIVEEYEKENGIKPFLISIKAGGVGINLTAANYVFIIDPWWNPFVEQQAIDRTHRIGQTKNVVVYRFISKDTIEDKIINLQQSKLNMSATLLDDKMFKKMNVETLSSLI